MKTKQLNKIDVFQSFHELMENNLMKWTNTGQFKDSYDIFIRNLNKINELKESAQEDLKTIKEGLYKIRTDIITKLIPVLNLIDLYALDNKKKALRKKADKIRNSLDGLSDKALESYVDEVTSIAERKMKIDPETQKSGARLESYGLSMKHIDQLKKDNMLFSELKNSLKESGKKVYQSKKELQKAIKENDTLLKRRISKFMSIYKLNDPDFYRAYKDALKNKKPAEIKEEQKDKSTSAHTDKEPVAVKKPSQSLKKSPARSSRTPGKAAGTKSGPVKTGTVKANPEPKTTKTVSTRRKKETGTTK